MDKQTDYEKARAEAWDKFRETELKDRPQWEPISNKEVFDYAFNAAYRYGVWCSMERKAQNSQINYIPDPTKKVDRIMIAAMAMQGILSNSVMMTETAKLSLQTLSLMQGGLQPTNEDVQEVAIKATACVAVNYADALINKLKAPVK